MSDFEKDLLYFASPALLGRKQANLFSFSINCLTDYRKEIDRYKKELAPLGISVEYLYCKKQRVTPKRRMRKPPFMKPCASCASVSFRAQNFRTRSGSSSATPQRTFSHSFAKKGITTSWLATGRFTATARPPCIHSAAMPDAEKDSWSKLPQVQILCLF